MRFAGARAEGLEEGDVDLIADDYASSALPPAEQAALTLADAIVGARPRALDPAEKSRLREHYDDAQITELALGLGLFHALSKSLIALGLEPEAMPVSVLPTPGDPPPPRS